MQKPIVCFDLDGTLLDREGRIHPEDIRILAENREAVFIPSTGRPLHAVKRMFARHGLFAGLPLPFPLVLQNGSLLYLPGEVLKAFSPFASDVQLQPMELFRCEPEITFLLLSINQIHVLWPHPFGVQAAESYDFLIQPYAPSGEPDAYSKIMCLSQNAETLRRLADASQGLAVERARSMTTILEFTPQGVHKGGGFDRLKEALCLNGTPVYAAGDGENDLDLLERALVSFAPRHSLETVRSKVNRVIDVEREGLLRPILREAGV